MEDEYEVKFSMYKTVSAFGKQEAQALSVSQALITHFATLSGYIAEISAQDKAFSQATLGKAEKKGRLRTELTDRILEISGPLYSYGFETSNQELMAITDMGKWDLKNLRDTEFSDRCSIIISAANLNISALEAHGILPEDINSAQDLNLQFDAAMDNREFSQSKRKSAKEMMIKVFEKTDLLIKKQIDKDMQIFRRRNPELLRTYEASRIIKNIGVRHEHPEENTQTPKTEDPILST